MDHTALDFTARIGALILAVIVLGLTSVLALAIFKLWVIESVSQVVTRSYRKR